MVTSCYLLFLFPFGLGEGGIGATVPFVIESKYISCLIKMFSLLDEIFISSLDNVLTASSLS